MKNVSVSVVMVGAALFYGCGGDAFGTGPDPAVDGGSPTVDGGVAAIAQDGAAVDAGVQPDVLVDTGVGVHIGVQDAGTSDAGEGLDSAVVDAGEVHDSAVADAGHDSGCTPVTHSNGVGQTWQDCVPLGTYEQSEAMKACVAATGSAAQCAVVGCGSAVQNMVCVNSTSLPCDCWAYQSQSTGVSGHVSTSCGCPGAGDPTWD